ncbi:alpha/beta hydrolase [uncultured Alsobacter sp.]|uniref:alpha/beta hydrolase n=1 Tax=uncultured Alsobacter sp. TaxID=1748258 RepID=UPI0025D3C4F8|nr:alpha/beta hydrolase [uncultured Alsobacter sp.]
MAIHPEAQSILDLMGRWQRENGVPPRSQQTVVEQRQWGRRTAELRLAGEMPPMASVEDVTLATRAGPRPARVLRPKAGAAGPTFVYVHGGGYVVGSVDETELEARRFAMATGATVVSLSYRLAPEHPWPAGVDDIEDGLLALAGGAVPGLDTTGLALAGVSAGAGLVAAATRRLVLAGRPLVGTLVLLSPWLDMTLTSPSTEIFATGHQLERSSLVSFCRDTIPAGMDPGHPELSPARHPVPAGWPRTLVLAAGCDPLVDDAALFVRRLDEVGVPHALRVVPGMLHGFHGWWQRLPAIAPDLAWLDTAVRDGWR